MQCTHAGRALPTANLGSNPMIVLGVILILIGYLLPVPGIIATIGWILLVIGLVLLVLGRTGRAVGGRRYWY
jgi:membrane-bound ClpP family serine protease